MDDFIDCPSIAKDVEQLVRDGYVDVQLFEAKLSAEKFDLDGV
jgi:hypothetical protein